MMTIAELEALIEDWRSGGADDDTPVLLATQPTYPLISHLAGGVAVCGADDGEDEDGHPTGEINEVILCEGAQRYDAPYPTGYENEALEEGNWK